MDGKIQQCLERLSEASYTAGKSGALSAKSMGSSLYTRYDYELIRETAAQKECAECGVDQETIDRVTSEGRAAGEAHRLLIRLADEEGQEQQRRTRAAEKAALFGFLYGKKGNP